METVASTPLGLIPVGLAAVGFFVFGLSRLLGAFRDLSASVLSRVTTALQGLFSLGLTEVPASCVLGSRSTGSEHQQRTTTGRLLILPAGRVILIALGLIFIGTCVLIVPKVRDLEQKRDAGISHTAGRQMTFGAWLDHWQTISKRSVRPSSVLFPPVATTVAPSGRT